MRGRSVLCGLAIAVGGGWATASATSEAGTYGYQHLRTDCVAKETSFGHVIVAHTRWQMWNTAASGNDLDGYRWKARLIPEAPGLNFHRSWNEVELGEVSADGAGNYSSIVTTEPMSATADWDLQVKLTWNRADRADWNVEHVLEFDENACATV